ncbi:MAG: transcription repressor NadR [Clostridiales bacterium]|nr:transcription repressor NadR [Clostridiales bacterium]
MKVTERRMAIVNLLLASKTPVSGGELAEKFNVSRQIIVQDITVLKGLGYEIFSTHHGYVLQKSPLVERVYKLKHTTEQTEDELNSIVDLGGTVVDVFVWHKVYGKISATLNIFSRLHVKQFLEGVRTGKSSELMNITGGYHYHTVRAESEEILDKIGNALAEKNYIALGD